MKQNIVPDAIRNGDLIRVDVRNGLSGLTAVEYTARHYGDVYVQGDVADFSFYLLDRPKPPVEPYWGMVVGDPSDCVCRAVYCPGHAKDKYGWLTYSGLHEDNNWNSTEWIEEKLAEGWVVIEKPEGV